MLSGIFFLNFFSRIFFAPLLPEFERSLHLSHTQAGLFFFFISSGYFIALISSGFVASRFGHKHAILLSMVGISLSLGFLSQTTNILYFRLALFLIGLSAGIYLPSAIATISTLFKPHLWGRAFSVHELAPNLAFLAAPLYVALLLPQFSLQHIVQLPAVCILAAALLYAWTGANTRTKVNKPDLKLYCSLLWRRDFQIMVLLFSMGITSTLGIFSILPTYLISARGFSEHQANILIGASRIPPVGAALAGGFLADYIGHRRAIGLVLFCSGIMTILLGRGGELLIPAVWLQPVFAVCFFPAGFAMLSHIGSPETRNFIVSLTIPLSFVIGGGVIPAVITAMADHGLVAEAIILVGCLLAIGSFLTIFINRKTEGDRS